MQMKLAAAGLFLMASYVAQASTITYVTPTGATTSGPVDASATITTGSGTVTITLTDLQANPTDVAQLISDFDFTLSNGATTGTLETTLSANHGQEITVNSGGTYTLGSSVVTGWGLNNGVSGGLQLDALGFIGPEHLIIGPPGAGNLYSNANGSIAANGPHNPFLDGPVVFTVDVAGVTSATTITSATFSFGTTAGINVPGVATPEPTSLLWILGAGLAGLAVISRRKKLAASESK